MTAIERGEILSPDALGVAVHRARPRPDPILQPDDRGVGDAAAPVRPALRRRGLRAVRHDPRHHRHRYHRRRHRGRHHDQVHRPRRRHAHRPALRRVPRRVRVTGRRQQLAVDDRALAAASAVEWAAEPAGSPLVQLPDRRARLPAEPGSDRGDHGRRGRADRAGRHIGRAGPGVRVTGLVLAVLRQGAAAAHYRRTRQDAGVPNDQAQLHGVAAQPLDSRDRRRRGGRDHRVGGQRVWRDRHARHPPPPRDVDRVVEVLGEHHHHQGRPDPGARHATRARGRSPTRTRARTTPGATAISSSPGSSRSMRSVGSSSTAIRSSRARSPTSPSAAHRRARSLVGPM